MGRRDPQKRHRPPWGSKGAESWLMMKREGGQDVPHAVWALSSSGGGQRAMLEARRAGLRPSALTEPHELGLIGGWICWEETPLSRK